MQQGVKFRVGWFEGPDRGRDEEPLGGGTGGKEPLTRGNIRALGHGHIIHLFEELEPVDNGARGEQRGGALRPNAIKRHTPFLQSEPEIGRLIDQVG